MQTDNVDSAAALVRKAPASALAIADELARAFAVTAVERDRRGGTQKKVLPIVRELEADEARRAA